MADNLFEDLKDVLQDFKDFLDENVPTIKPAIEAIAGLIPQVTELIDLLLDLVGKLRTEIENLDVGSVPGLSETAEFTEKVKSLLEAARKLLPDETDAIGEIEDVADVVTGLPSLDAVKAEIVGLLTAITGHLENLKP